MNNNIVVTKRVDRPALSKAITFNKLEGYNCYQVCYNNLSKYCNKDYNISQCGFYALDSKQPFKEYALRVLDYLKTFDQFVDDHNARFKQPIKINVDMIKESRDDQYQCYQVQELYIDSVIVDNCKLYTLKEAKQQIEHLSYCYHKFIKSVIAPIECGYFKDVEEFINFLKDYVNKV